MSPVVNTVRSRVFQYFFQFFPQLLSTISTIFQNILRSQTAAGMRHRDHGTTGSVIHKNIRPALTTYFFGLDGEKKLTVDKFSQFQEQLQVR